ncbi:MULTISPECIES: hypothetical protein [unclassified Pseudomonas]|uniref:hypothetical protein n=1 Tax=unclassified Pseudomonas TaxID=196821 RepID=UPI002248F273|nr:hypothetical protein [Pseudomonas sp. DCB_BG]MCX2708358.1 hypothetical protein [Pseudomonas sp. DCB_BG]
MTELELLRKYGVGSVAKDTPTLTEKSATELDRASFFTAYGLTQAAAEDYVERLAMLSDDTFLAFVSTVDAQIKVQKSQHAVDATTRILMDKYKMK